MKNFRFDTQLNRRTLLGMSLVLAFSERVQAQADTLAIVGKDNYLFAGWGTSDVPNWPAIDANVAKVALVSQRLAARGIALITPLLPSKKLFYAKELPEDEALTPEMLGRYAGIRERLVAAQVNTFDAETLFRSLQTTGVDVYYRTDQHWTQPAADASAAATAQVINRLVPRLAGESGTGMALGEFTRERRYGDLADRFLSSEQRRSVGREVFNVRRPSPAPDLLEATLSPVHVTGNSMVQPYFGFPQKLSNLLDRPVTVNWKPGDVGFWLVLMEYLESAGFRKAPPQALVWQLFEPNFHLGPDAKGLWDSASLITEQDWSRRLEAALPA